jgi:hypothetical protein
MQTLNLSADGIGNSPLHSFVIAAPLFWSATFDFILNQKIISSRCVIRLHSLGVQNAFLLRFFISLT